MPTPFQASELRVRHSQETQLSLEAQDAGQLAPMRRARRLPGCLARVAGSAESLLQPSIFSIALASSRLAAMPGQGRQTEP